MDGLVMMQPFEQHCTHVLSEVIGTTLDIRTEGVEINQLGSFHCREISGCVAFEGVDEEE